MLLSLKIIPNSILYDISRPVTDSEYGDDLKVHMDNMAETMYAHTGIGLSGVQVGDLRRILVADLGYVRTKTYGGDTVYMVNPSIVEQSDKKTKASEGCLSYPKLECALERPDWIVVNYYLPNGDNVIERFEGYEARIILHEMDHFDGITLYTGMSNFKRKRYDKAVIKILLKLSKYMKDKVAA